MILKCWAYPCKKNPGKLPSFTVQISRNRRSSPSPSGRRWREAPDEALHSRDFTPLTRRFAPPSPGGRGTPPKQVGIRVAVPEPALALDIRRSRLRNLDSNGHRPPLQWNVRVSRQKNLPKKQRNTVLYYSSLKSGSCGRCQTTTARLPLFPVAFPLLTQLDRIAG